MEIWKGVITHPKPHFDEIVGLFLLQAYGYLKYPHIIGAIKKRDVLFLREDQFKLSPEKCEEEGWLLLGVGGGKFDEHATANNEGRKEGKCSAVLVAEDLGIERNPELKQLLRFVSVVDLNASAQPFDISSIVKLLHEQNPDDPWVAIDWVFTAFTAKQTEQYQFHVEAPKASREAHRELIGETLVASVETDCPVVSKYLRTKEAGRVDVIIQKSPTNGQVQIFTNEKVSKNVADTAISVLRLLEQKANGRTGKIPHDDLIREGTLESVPEWYYFKKGGMFLNGSQTAPNTPATKIPLPVIFEAIAFVIARTRNINDLWNFVINAKVNQG